MRELKARLLGQTMNEYGCDTKIYLKSEADKVIENLSESHNKEVGQLLMRIAELKKQVHYYSQNLYVIQARAEKEARNHKYKRCLDMAKICQLRHERYEQYVTKYKDCNGPTIQRWRFLKSHYSKWYKRWLELAKKFKPDNSTAR